jgi:uncharacterized YccA/Bax inhibitor family protein
VQGFDDGTMGYDGVLSKAFGLFVLAAGAAIAVALLAPGLALPLSAGAFVTSLIVAFRRKAPSVPLYVITLTLWGGAAGGISAFYEAAFNGIVLHALLATATVFAVSLAVYKSGRIRNFGKINKFLMIAVPAIVIFSLVDVGMVMMGGDSVRDATIGGSSIPWGLIISGFAIVVGAFMLMSDFNFVDTGVRNGLPKIYEWTAAYGLVFAVIWIYVEMLRLLSYLRGR